MGESKYLKQEGLMRYIGNTTFKMKTPDFADHRAELQGTEDSLAARIREGLRAAEFRVAFQPIIHAESNSVTGVECLLRWQHPHYGLLLPGSFVSAFDDPQVAREATCFVLEQACAQLGEAKRAGRVLPRIAVNIRPFQLVDDSLCASIRELTTRHGIDPSLLELELLETEDVSKVLSTHEFTQSLRQLGVRMALDDFGSGFSSLAALSLLHLDTIKVAREFLIHVPASNRACIVLDSILDLLGKLDVTIVVEGVESAEQLCWLTRYHDIHVQGYHLAKPMANLAEAIARVLSR